MRRFELNRRDFNKLTVAAFGGLVAGTSIGCPQQQDEGADAAGEAGATSQPAESGAEPEQPAETADVAYLLEEPHVCRGLNACANKGAGAENACAGQGSCATAEHHECSGQNACKGQGGCGEHPGQNACKGQGECAVPLMDDAWSKAREAFEQAMAEAGNEVGEAPPKG